MLMQTHNFDPRRAAILEAADLIEKYPERFRFYLHPVPTDCGSPGCALGLIGYCAGLTAQENMPKQRTNHAKEYYPCTLVASDVASWLGVGEVDFYLRMGCLVNTRWVYNADICVEGLRLYADVYHPARLPA